MNDEPINLGAHRAEKTDNAAAWTPIEMLKAVISEIERGERKVDIALLILGERLDDGYTDTDYQLAGTGSVWEALGIMERAKFVILDVK